MSIESLCVTVQEGKEVKVEFQRRANRMTSEIPFWRWHEVECRYLASIGLEASPRRPQCLPSVEEGQEMICSSGGGRAQSRGRKVSNPSVANGSNQRRWEGELNGEEGSVVRVKRGVWLSDG